MARRRRRRNSSYRTGALVGAGIGIAIGLASIGRVPRLGTSWGIAGAALGGLVVGAAAAGARTGSDFKKALLEGK